MIVTMRDMDVCYCPFPSFPISFSSTPDDLNIIRDCQGGKKAETFEWNGVWEMDEDAETGRIARCH